MRIIVFVMALLLTTSQAFAHAGHDDAPGESATPQANVIELAESTIKNLGIQASPATLAAFGKAISLNATIEYVPERYATVTAKANGTVNDIAVKIGDPVKKGQKIFSFMPTFVGSSPVAILSPIDGFIVKQNTVIGQPLTPETVVAEIADTTQVLVKGITYSPTDFEQIKAGQSVKVVFDHAEPLDGTVQRLDVGSDKENKTFAVYALVNNPQKTLFANSSAALSVTVEDAGDVLTVPAKAVLGEMGNYFLFVQENNSFERRTVTLGRKSGDRIEIIDGVLPDEQVVTVGNYQLQYAKTQAPANPATGHKE